MIEINVYNNGIDETWYDSSSIVYTKFTENKDDNYGDLYVVFKNGSMYKYFNVDMIQHYIPFKHSLKDSSTGKSLNYFIKPYYQYERLDNISFSELEEHKKDLLKNNDPDNNIFVFGYPDLSKEEFTKFYLSPLSYYADDETKNFLISDEGDFSMMVQNLLIDTLNISPERIILYHTGTTPLKKHDLVNNTKGCYDTDDVRDSIMSKSSSIDLGFIRDVNENTSISRNLLRRYQMS